MRVHVLQHAPFEGLGSIQHWLSRRQAEVAYVRLYAGDALPSLEGTDMLIAMGGPMSVNDEVAFPWLRGEKQAIRGAIDRGTPVLGVCLGAQLIASALGARVYPNAEKEIGWFPVQAVQGVESAFAFPSECTVLHWHGETFDLPPGAMHLARSEACEHQAFQVGHNVIGLQFHLEMTADGLRAMVENGRDELSGGRYVQGESALLGVAERQYEATNELMGHVLTYLTDAPVRLAEGTGSSGEPLRSIP